MRRTLLYPEIKHSTKLHTLSRFLRLNFDKTFREQHLNFMNIITQVNRETCSLGMTGSFLPSNI